MAIVTEKEKYLLSQQHKKIGVRLNLLNQNFTFISSLDGALKSLSLSINADSDVRRTGTMEIFPEFDGYELIDETKSTLWIDRYIKVYLDFTYLPTKEIFSYCIGTFIIDTKTFSYNESTNSLSINLVDLMAKLDGTHGGELGAESIVIEVDSVIRNAMIKILEQNAGITKYNLDEYIGAYRHKGVPDDDKVSYELEFPDGCTVLEAITKLRDLHVGYEIYFDTEGTFNCHLIPTCETDEEIIDSKTFYNDVSIYSENRNYSYTGIYNIVQTYGKIYDDIDRYADSENASFTGNVLNIKFEKFEAYTDYTYFAIKMTQPNPDNMKININGLGEKSVTSYLNGNELDSGFLSADTIYVFLYQGDAFKYLTDYQATGVAILLSKEPTSSQKDGYISQYSCKNIAFVIEPDNPFCVDKIGTLYKRLNGTEEEDIGSDEEALSNSKYYLWKYARLTNTITIVCSIIPFLDVNQKFSYMHLKSGNMASYITKQINMDITEDSAQMTITASTFNPLYPDIL